MGDTEEVAPMFDLPILRMSSLMLRHAAKTQETVASNIARADVPGATRHRVADFADAYVRMSRGETLKAQETAASIDLEQELLDLTSAAGRRDTGAGIWKSTLTMLRMAMAAPR
ncbi:MAG: hypothetical protein V2I43_18020 [Parvularcula sp.]|jgi:hypothetical protein|nr:hypothetical protein [Parvularcula sp.]